MRKMSAFLIVIVLAITMVFSACDGKITNMFGVTGEPEESETIVVQTENSFPHDKIFWFLIFLGSVVIFCVWAGKDSNKEYTSESKWKYDGRIVKTGINILEDLYFKNPFEDNRTFDVEREGNIFTINNRENGYSISISGYNGKGMVKGLEKEHEPLKVSDVMNINAKQYQVINMAYAMAVNYVKASKILKNKARIIASLGEVDVKLAEMDSSICFDEFSNTIYINKKNFFDISLWLLLHEYIRALSFITNGGKDKQYSHSLFDEGITDIITLSMYPPIAEDYISDYSSNYFLLYPYIGIFKEKAIEAYFYGYSEIVSEISETEFDLFVFAIENYGKVDTANLAYNNLILKWKYQLEK